MKHDLSADIGGAPVADERYRTFLKTLQSLQEPLALADSALLAHPLIQQALQQEPGVLPYQALKKVFGEILDLLAVENATYADLLRGRFWEGQQVEEMLTAERPMAMSRRTFANYQKNAIQTFAFLFLQAEAGRQPQNGATLPSIPGRHSPTTPTVVIVPPAEGQAVAAARRVKVAPPQRWLLGVGALLLALGVIGLLLWRNSGGMGAEQILFADDFENGLGQWWLQERDLWTVRVEAAGNHVLCVQTTGNYTYALAGSTTWRDYIIQLDLKILTVADNGSGNLIWRVADELQPFYLVDFFANRVGGAVLAKESPVYQSLAENMRGFPEKQWVPVRIEVKGGQMAIFAGAEPTPLLEAIDATPILQGGIGLGAGFPVSENGGAWEICFDNVRVTAW